MFKVGQRVVAVKRIDAAVDRGDVVEITMICIRAGRNFYNAKKVTDSTVKITDVPESFLEEQ